jgi:hypothetical protein
MLRILGIPVPVAPEISEQNAKTDNSCISASSNIMVCAGERYFGKGEVESSILSCSTINSSELSTVFLLKSLCAASLGQKVSSRLSQLPMRSCKQSPSSAKRKPGPGVLKTRLEP